MPAVLTSPHLLDAIMALTVLEAVLLVASGWLTIRATARMLLPGAGLLVALRMALAGDAWPWVPAALAASLLAHIFDLWSRRRP
jgi:hypothetical protein